MSPLAQTYLKFATALILGALALSFVSKRVNEFRKSGEEASSIWFYDLSEKRLYEVPQGTIPPHQGIGGPKGDGVHAVVVAFRADQNNPNKRRIAYLETYSPELKNLLEKVKNARATGQTFTGSIPARDSEFFQTNSLVKSPDETEWHASNSPEGQRVTTDWKTWRGPDGQQPVVCVP